MPGNLETIPRIIKRLVVIEWTGFEIVKYQVVIKRQTGSEAIFFVNISISEWTINLHNTWPFIVWLN